MRFHAKTARNPAPFVKLIDRYDILMRRDLKDAVRARVENRPACLDMLIAQLLDDLGAASRAIPDNLSTDLLSNTSTRSFGNPFG